MSYEADLSGTAAGLVKADVSGDAPSGFSFVVKKLGMAINIGQFFGLFDPDNNDKEFPVTFHTDVVVDQAQLLGDISINGKTDVLSVQIQKPVEVSVEGDIMKSTAKVATGVITGSLARHMKFLADLGAEPTKQLTIAVTRPRSFEAFDPKKLGDMVGVSGVVSAQLTEPSASSIFKTVRCEVAADEPIGYKPLITEVVDNFGRVLEQSYGWTEDKFTGNAPGVVAKICTIQ